MADSPFAKRQVKVQGAHSKLAKIHKFSLPVSSVTLARLIVEYLEMGTLRYYQLCTVWVWLQMMLKLDLNLHSLSRTDLGNIKEKKSQM